MFGEKLKQHFGNIKHHLGQTYHKTKHFLGQVDIGVRIAKKSLWGVGSSHRPFRGWGN